MVAGDVADHEALALAERAHALVESDAVAGAELAGRALTLARARGDREAEVAALHALGFARHELGDARAVRTLRAAVRTGERHGLAARAAMARRPLAVNLAYRGPIAVALRELDAACAALDPLELARTEVFRIALLHLAGRSPPSSASSDRALRTLRRAGDTIWEARLLGNRGVLLAERGDAAAAEPDLARARELFAAAGASAAAAGAELELARVALLRGDLPVALARLDAIDSRTLPALHASALELLRAKALVAARLLDEARPALARAVSIWQRAGFDEPAGRLEVITLTLLAGDPAAAGALAASARRAFAAQRRPAYAAQATGLWLAAAIAGDTVTPSGLRAGRRAAATLRAAGWHEESRRAQLAVARAAIMLGSVGVARRELAACAPLRRRGPVADRIEAWHVEALIALAAGDRAGAQRAARRGLALLEAYRAALGASELRVTASAIGVALSRLGLRVALDGGDPGAVLAWAERLRASALRLPAVTPPAAGALRDRMIDLRRVHDDIRRAEADGRSERALLGRQAALEDTIRRLSRHATGAMAGAGPAGSPGSGDGAGGAGRVRGSAVPPGRHELTRALGDAALVELIELDGELAALTLAGGRLRRHALGPAAPVAEELQWLRFALARLARLPRRGGGAAARATAQAGAEASALALDECLMGTLAADLERRSLVIIPTGSLHGVPWALLPSLRGRALAVAPSAALWLAGRSRRRRRPRVVLVGGPRLRHAASEVAALGDLYPGARRLGGRGATVAAVMDALDGAAIAHLACHGRFRADSPLFSSLELADGPLTVYELQRLRRPPEMIVLSACDLASSDTRPGDELLGFAAALLGMGARTVIASVVAAPDAAAKRMMIALHRELRAGATPSAALAVAQAGLRRGEAALGGFLCLGSG